MAEEPRAIKEASVQQIPEHQHQDLGHELGVHAAGVVGGVVRAGHRGLPVKARVLGALAAQRAQVPGRFTAVALFVKGVARAGAAQKGADDLPPDMGGGVTAHHLQTGVRQRVEPLIEPGEHGGQQARQQVGDQARVEGLAGLAAHWLATCR